MRLGDAGIAADMQARSGAPELLGNLVLAAPANKLHECWQPKRPATHSRTRHRPDRSQREVLALHCRRHLIAPTPSFLFGGLTPFHPHPGLNLPLLSLAPTTYLREGVQLGDLLREDLVDCCQLVRKGRPAGYGDDRWNTHPSCAVLVSSCAQSWARQW